MNSVNIDGYTLLVGDRVTSKADGEQGYISYICDCSTCVERGWNDIVIQLNNGETDYISNKNEIDNWDTHAAKPLNYDKNGKSQMKPSQKKTDPER